MRTTGRHREHWSWLRQGLRTGVLLLATGLLLSACGSSSDPEPGIWVAAALPVAPDATGSLTKAPIRAFDLVTGKERQFGDPARYYALAWSPDGSRLAALDWDQVDSNNTVVHL